MVYCYNCGKDGHIARRCRSNHQNVPDSVCQLCGKTDHITEHCHLNTTEQETPNKQRRIIKLSLLFDQPTVIKDCKICKESEHTIECPFGDPSVNVRKHPEDYISQINLCLGEEKRKCRMALATGSDVSVLKMKAVPPHVPIVSDDTIQLQTMAGRDITHLGKIRIKVFDYLTKFYVVSDDIGIGCDGVLGSNFFYAVSAVVSTSFLKVNGKQYPLMHFSEDFISIPPKSSVTDYVNVLTSDLVEGYLPRLIFGKGIFTPDGLVSVKDKKAYLQIFNYTKYAIEIPRPCVEIEPVRSVTNYMDKVSNIELITNLLANECKFEKISEAICKDGVKTVTELLRLDHLNNEELSAVKRWIENYHHLFHLSRDELNMSYNVIHEVSCKDDVPVECKQFSLSAEEKVEMKKVIDELLYRGIIRVSDSPYDSPAYVAPDKPDSQGNKKWKLIVDYSKLNEKIKDDAYPIPCVQDILDSLGGARYFSVLHLASGYHQIQMNPDDIPKTAFSTPDGHFEFKRMPAGLKNAPATFQRFLDDVLSGLQAEGLRYYLGSIIVVSKTLKKHEEILTKLGEKFKDVNLNLQPEQCEFFRKEVVYLGYKVSKDGVRPDSEKLKTIENFTLPQNQSDVRKFLGLANFYRRFIEGYSEIAKPLFNLLKAKEPFVWTNERNVAFNKLKDELCSEPLLQYPNFSEPFTVTVESSHFTIGGILTQGVPHKKRIIAHASRILSESEKGYEIHEKELLAIVYCIEQFRGYITDKKFNLVAKGMAFDLLDAVKTNQVQSTRISKWASQIAGYEYRKIYKGV